MTTAWVSPYIAEFERFLSAHSAAEAYACREAMIGLLPPDVDRVRADAIAMRRDGSAALLSDIRGRERAA